MPGILALAKTRYTPSGPVTASANNQVIEGLEITSSSGSAVDTNGHTGVIVRKNRIYYSGGRGIRMDGAGGEISDNDIYYIGSGSGGGFVPSENQQPIFVISANNVNVLRNRTSYGNGPKVQTSDGVVIQYLQTTNNQGTNTTPGYGGGIAFDTCTNCSLLDFYIQNNLLKAWTGDNVNVYTGSGNTIARGLIDGNNCTVGGGVQIQQATGCSVTDIDFINWHQQGIGTFAGTNTIFTTCRAGYNLGSTCEQGRGATTASNPPAFYNEDVSATGTVFATCGYYLPISPNSVYFNEGSDSGHDITDAGAFTPRTPYIWVPAYV